MISTVLSYISMCIGRGSGNERGVVRSKRGVGSMIEHLPICPKVNGSIPGDLKLGRMDYDKACYS